MNAAINCDSDGRSSGAHQQHGQQTGDSLHINLQWPTSLDWSRATEHALDSLRYESMPSAPATCTKQLLVCAGCRSCQSSSTGQCRSGKLIKLLVETEVTSDPTSFSVQIKLADGAGVQEPFRLNLASELQEEKNVIVSARLEDARERQMVMQKLQLKVNRRPSRRPVGSRWIPLRVLVQREPSMRVAVAENKEQIGQLLAAICIIHRVFTGENHLIGSNLHPADRCLHQSCSNLSPESRQPAQTSTIAEDSLGTAAQSICSTPSSCKSARRHRTTRRHWGRRRRRRRHRCSMSSCSLTSLLFSSASSCSVPSKTNSCSFSASSTGSHSSSQQSSDRRCFSSCSCSLSSLVGCRQCHANKSSIRRHPERQSNNWRLKRLQQIKRCKRLRYRRITVRHQYNRQRLARLSLSHRQIGRNRIGLSAANRRAIWALPSVVPNRQQISEDANTDLNLIELKCPNCHQTSLTPVRQVAAPVKPKGDVESNKKLEEVQPRKVEMQKTSDNLLNPLDFVLRASETRTLSCTEASLTGCTSSSLISQLTAAARSRSLCTTVPQLDPASRQRLKGKSNEASSLAVVLQMPRKIEHLGRRVSKLTRTAIKRIKGISASNPTIAIDGSALEENTGESETHKVRQTGGSLFRRRSSSQRHERGPVVVPHKLNKFASTSAVTGLVAASHLNHSPIGTSRSDSSGELHYSADGVYVGPGGVCSWRQVCLARDRARLALSGNRPSAALGGAASWLPLGPLWLSARDELSRTPRGGASSSPNDRCTTRTHAPGPLAPVILVGADKLASMEEQERSKSISAATCSAQVDRQRTQQESRQQDVELELIQPVVNQVNQTMPGNQVQASNSASSTKSNLSNKTWILNLTQRCSPKQVQYKPALVVSESSSLACRSPNNKLLSKEARSNSLSGLYDKNKSSELSKSSMELNQSGLGSRHSVVMLPDVMDEQQAQIPGGKRQDQADSSPKVRGEFDGWFRRSSKQSIAATMQDDGTEMYGANQATICVHCQLIAELASQPGSRYLNQLLPVVSSQATVESSPVAAVRPAPDPEQPPVRPSVVLTVCSNRGTLDEGDDHSLVSRCFDATTSDPVDTKTTTLLPRQDQELLVARKGSLDKQSARQRSGRRQRDQHSSWSSSLVSAGAGLDNNPKSSECRVVVVDELENNEEEEEEEEEVYDDQYDVDEGDEVDEDASSGPEAGKLELDVSTSSQESEADYGADDKLSDDATSSSSPSLESQGGSSSGASSSSQPDLGSISSDNETSGELTDKGLLQASKAEQCKKSAANKKRRRHKNKKKKKQASATLNSNNDNNNNNNNKMEAALSKAQLSANTSGMLEVPNNKQARSASLDAPYLLKVPQQQQQQLDLDDDEEGAFSGPKSNRSRSVDISLPTRPGEAYRVSEGGETGAVGQKRHQDERDDKLAGGVLRPLDSTAGSGQKKFIQGEINVACADGGTRALKLFVDWGDTCTNGEHLWLYIGSSSEACYVGENECLKHGPRLCCSACKITAHTGCISILIDKIKFICKHTFRDMTVNNQRHLKELQQQNVIYHHWVHKRTHCGRCKQCTKTFGNTKLPFSSKEIQAITCSWCKVSYHNKENCYTLSALTEPCTLGAHRESIIPPVWIVKLPQQPPTTTTSTINQQVSQQTKSDLNQDSLTDLSNRILSSDIGNEDNENQGIQRVKQQIQNSNYNNNQNYESNTTLLSDTSGYVSVDAYNIAAKNGVNMYPVNRILADQQLQEQIPQSQPNDNPASAINDSSEEMIIDPSASQAVNLSAINQLQRDLNDQQQNLQGHVEQNIQHSFRKFAYSAPMADSQFTSKERQQQVIQDSSDYHIVEAQYQKCQQQKINENSGDDSAAMMEIQLMQQSRQQHQSHNSTKLGLYKDFRIIPQPIQGIPNAGSKPVLVFVNPRSGGNQGTKMMQKFNWLLNPRQVFDLIHSGGPRAALELYCNVPNLRILAIGGDGTASWILSDLDEVGIPNRIPVAVLPLGTGNDLARALGWGSGYADEPIAKILTQVRDGEVVQLDRWNLQVERNYEVGPSSPNEFSTSSGGVGGLNTSTMDISSPSITSSPSYFGSVYQGGNSGNNTSSTLSILDQTNCDTNIIQVANSNNISALNASSLDEAGRDRLPMDVINNYFSFGVDAHIALEFHTAREAHPERFNSRLRNKMFYGQAGGKDLLKRKWKDLSNFVTLYCDGQDMTSRLKELKVHSVLFLNIPSYGGGTRPWPTTATSFAKPRIDDGLIEVIGLTTYQLPLLQAGGHGTCIAQCRSAKIITSRTIPMQVDGEPCKLLPSIINISFKNKVCMLAKSKGSNKNSNMSGGNIQKVNI